MSIDDLNLTRGYIQAETVIPIDTYLVPTEVLDFILDGPSGRGHNHPPVSSDLPGSAAPYSLCAYIDHLCISIKDLLGPQLN